MDKRSRNWVICAGLTALVFLFMGSDPCSSEEYEAGLCEYDDTVTGLGACSCLGALGFAGLALMTKKEEEGQELTRATSACGMSPGQPAAGGA